MSDNPADSIRRELEAGRTLDDPLTRLIADTLAHRVSEDWHRVEDMNTKEMMLMVILDAVAVREVVEAVLEAARADERKRLQRENQKLRAVSERLKRDHRIAHYDGQSLEAVCSCGTLLGSVYGTTRTYAQLFAAHLQGLAVSDGN